MSFSPLRFWQTPWVHCRRKDRKLHFTESENRNCWNWLTVNLQGFKQNFIEPDLKMPEIHSMIFSMKTYAPPLIFQNSVSVEYVPVKRRISGAFILWSSTEERCFTRLSLSNCKKFILTPTCMQLNIMWDGINMIFVSDRRYAKLFFHICSLWICETTFWIAS